MKRRQAQLGQLMAPSSSIVRGELRASSMCGQDDGAYSCRVPCGKFARLQVVTDTRLI
jgi:hypothetical protein